MDRGSHSDNGIRRGLVLSEPNEGLVVVVDPYAVGPSGHEEELRRATSRPQQHTHVIGQLPIATFNPQQEHQLEPGRAVVRVGVKSLAQTRLCRRWSPQLEFDHIRHASSGGGLRTIVANTLAMFEGKQWATKLNSSLGREEARFIKVASDPHCLLGQLHRVRMPVVPCRSPRLPQQSHSGSFGVGPASHDSKRHENAQRDDASEKPASVGRFRRPT